MMSIMGEVFSLAKLAIPAAAALLGVWLQGRFSRNTAASNRLWDLKRAAYAELLVSLREAEVAANDAAAVFERDGDSSPALQEHYAIYREHQKKLRQRMLPTQSFCRPPSRTTTNKRSRTGCWLASATKRGRRKRALWPHT
jgi:hypothetical protein